MLNRSRELRLRKLRDFLNIQLSSGLLVFALFWLPRVLQHLLTALIIVVGYQMLKTFIMDKRYMWVISYIILVLLPFLMSISSDLGISIDTVFSLLPFLSFLFLSFILKMVIHDWIEEAHFKALQLNAELAKQGNDDSGIL